MNRPPKPTRAAWPLALLLAYALGGAAWSVAGTPLAPSEAAALLAARERAGAPGCGDAGGVLELVACSLPGAAALVPRLAAAGDRLGGLAGARAVCALAVPALVLLVFSVGSSRRWGGHGLLAAAAFVALGVPLQLLATVHPRALAALLVGVAAALLERRPPERPPGSVGASLRAALAGGALALAVTATPVAALFALPLAIAFAITGARTDRGGAATFVAAAAGVLALSAGLAGPSAWDGLGEALRSCPPGGWSAAAPRVTHVLDGLAMPLLLATFAVFHRDGGGRAALAILLAAPAFLVPLLGVRVDDGRTAQLLAFAILAPAAGVGVAAMSGIFAAGNPSRLARPLFAAAVLVVAAVHGIHEMRSLRRDGPDLSAAVAFLKGAGAGGQTLLVESDFGAPEGVYRYALGSGAARVVPVARADAAERRQALRTANPDWVVLDTHHAGRSFAAAEQDYLAQGFAVAASWTVPVGAGSTRVEVLRREPR